MIGISQNQFEKAFPFHVALDADLVIVQCGRSFEKLCGRDPLGKQFDLFLKVRYPFNVELGTEALIYKQLFVLDFQPQEIAFRGEFVASDTEDVILFLGGPWIADQSGLTSLGLRSSDFATHDPLIDLMHLNQTQRISLAESKVLAEKLKEQSVALTEACDLAEQGNLTKSTFLANMSHELRTPLNTVLGFADLMAKAPDATENQLERLGIIRRSGHYLLDLMNDLLDMSKIESGSTGVHLTAFDLRAILVEIEDMFRQRAEDKGLEYRVSLNSSLTAVKSDVRKIRQIIFNLVGNAIKFTEEGIVGVHATWTNDGGLEFVVSDTGPGIREEHQDQVFMPFERGDSEKTQHEGAGLGLAICKRFIDLLGGDIQLESVIGKGTTFTVTVPVEVLDRGNEAAVSEAINSQPDANGEIENLIPETHLASRESLEKLAIACSGLEFQGVKESLQQIERKDPATATRLAKLAGEFRYDEMEELIKSMMDNQDANNAPR
jgi:signal transduction histidine kinase